MLPACIVRSEILSPCIDAIVGQDMQAAVKDYGGVELAAKAVSMTAGGADGENDAFVNDL